MDEETLKQLLNMRIDALEKMVSRELKHIQEAIERVADQAAPVATVQALLRRIEQLEKGIDRLHILRESREDIIKALEFKLRVVWWLLASIGAIVLGVVSAFIKNWIGI